MYIGVFVIVVPNAAPANVMGNSVTSTSIFVQWDEVPGDNQNGNIVNYTVTYTELPNGSSLDVVVIAPKRNITLVQLNKFTNYSITVFASTSKGGGSRSNPIFVITDEDSKYDLFWCSLIYTVAILVPCFTACISTFICSFLIIRVNSYNLFLIC